ncbi:MAG: 2-C-methyl-D-erythritol 2,4-cyclodiphosphate synthase [Bacteroidia bacterium]|nr:MAG: 2-C-methyl-D-erythritol 2,4-cyclodiphosphate synthase [Bacteroidia bacterium]
MRIGFGHDVHALAPGRPLVIGGVMIPFHKGPAGHSDADVLIHAIMDALLGAAALRDIGTHFPDNDERYRNADSKWLLQQVMRLVTEMGYRVSNVDATVCLQTPTITHYVPEMQKILADLMRIDPGQVSVKATTTEHLGFIGRGEGISAYAVALLISSDFSR